MNLERFDRDESLDPEDWAEMRALGHRMLDDMMSYLEGVRDRYVWQPMPDEIREAFVEPLPARGSRAEDVYEEFRRNVLPYPMGNIHPRFWGWVMGNNTPLGVLADMLASGINPNMGGGDHAPALVEAQVIEWCPIIRSWRWSRSPAPCRAAAAPLCCSTAGRWPAARRRW
jgi:aromatic-L-amino-acid decarboxylase